MIVDKATDWPERGDTVESGFYRCSNSETDTRDWIRLNFDSFQATILHTLAETKPEILEDLERIDLGEEPDAPDEPCPYALDEEPKPSEYEDTAVFTEHHTEWQEGFDEYQEYKVAYAKWAEEYEEWESSQQLMNWPVAWNTMWAAQNNDNLVEALAASGFVVYRTSGELEDFGPIVFGVDGCGYGFYGAHWIPLRARLVRCQYDSGYLRGEAFASVLESMIPLVKEQGDDPKRFLVEYGSGVVEMGKLECVIGWELHKELGLDP